MITQENLDYVVEQANEIIGSSLARIQEGKEYLSASYDLPPEDEYILAYLFEDGGIMPLKFDFDNEEIHIIEAWKTDRMTLDRANSIRDTVTNGNGQHPSVIHWREACEVQISNSKDVIEGLRERVQGLIAEG